MLVPPPRGLAPHPTKTLYSPLISEYYTGERFKKQQLNHYTSQLFFVLVVLLLDADHKVRDIRN